MALTSLWQDRHPRSPLEASTPATLSGEHDVVVVGGGLTGLTTAVLLARAGRSVLVVEAGHVGVGTTGRSTAKISLLQGTQFSRLSRRHPDQVLRRYAEANLEAQAWLVRFCADQQVGIQDRPAYTYATTALGERMIRAELKAVRTAGLEAEWLDEVPLPYPTRGAVRLADQKQVDPCELLEALSREAVAHGVRLVEGVRVRRVTGKDPVQVVSEHGTATARTVVVATNMPVLDRGGFFARMSPSRSYGLAFRTAEPHVDGMYLSADSPSRSLRDAPGTDGASLLLVGGNGHKVGAPVSEQQRIEGLREWTAHWFPDAEETHAWSAQDYVPHHGLPFAGPVLPGADEVLVAGGYSKWGMTNGVAAALAVAGQVLGEQRPWADILRPWQRAELRGALDTAKLNGEVALEMAGGWLRPALHPGAGTPPTEGQGTVRLDHAGPPTAVSTVDGTERRVSAVCSHLGGVVRWNDAERSWDCPLHGSRFGPDGEVLEGPATCGLGRR
ncbi:FAD-dependent oxidoreductase [Nocardioides pantholopis]|uniref:FAD-dependent oxidoreductase n=1 Tax=Nocardioides pantholopis TaxID=2483798 RepID=UPI0019D2A494|nr:FAD-dependent oxidoreductase [Nocardioides pantholopis]